MGSMLPHTSIAQSDFPFKESFDGLYAHYTTGSNTYIPYTPDWYKKWGWNLFALSTLWETTGDKDYAFKLTKHSYQLLVYREDDGWLDMPSGNDDFHYTGELMAPMARFAYLALSNTDLSTTLLPPGLLPGSLDGEPMVTVGDYGAWLADQVLEIWEDYFWNHWSTDLHCLVESQPDEGEDAEGAALNFQAHYTQIALYLYAIGNCSGCNVWAANLSDYFENNLSVYPGNQSMTWFHNPSFVGDDDGLREDVAHGATDILVPIAAHELYGEGYYSSTQMAQFANTFTKNIWDAGDDVFRNNVFGLDYDISGDQTLCSGSIEVNGSPNFYAPGEVLAWMGLQTYDQSDGPNNIYTVLTTQAQKLLTNDVTAHLPAGYCHTGATSQLSGQQSYYGLAEVVKAQWARECFDLTLFNREVAYDQDFAAKGTLTIDPASGPGPSFADPVITDPVFHIGSGRHMDLRAGEAVHLLPGFYAEAGSEVSVSIDPLGCAMQVCSMTASPPRHLAVAKAILEPPATPDHSDATAAPTPFLKVFPNPCSEFVQFSSDRDGLCELMDARGTVLQTWTLHTGRSTQPVKELAAGTYFIRFVAADVIHIVPLVRLP